LVELIHVTDSTSETALRDFRLSRDLCQLDAEKPQVFQLLLKSIIHSTDNPRGHVMFNIQFVDLTM